MNRNEILRNAIMGSQNKTPYKRLKSVELDGNQYIKSGFYSHADVAIATVCESNAEVTMFVGGCRVSFNNSMLCLADNFYGTQGWLFQFGNTFRDSDDFNPDVLFGEKVSMYLAKEGSTLNGVYIGTDFTTTTLTPLEIYVGGVNQNGTIEGRNYRGKIYEFKIWDNGVLVRNFIPVMMLDTKEVGFWDLVENKFYENSGTGRFIPEYYYDYSKYTPLDFIESTGTQYIDLGIPNTGDYEVIDTIKLPTGSENSGFIFGGRLDFANTLALYYIDSNKFYTAYGGSSTYVSTGLILNDWNIIYFNRFEIIVNKIVTTQAGQTLIPVDKEAPMYLFATSDQGTVEPRMMKGQRRRFIIYNNTGDVTINLIPVMLKHTNEVGMWDMIEDKFYGNKGTGEFIAGNPI